MIDLEEEKQKMIDAMRDSGVITVNTNTKQFHEHLKTWCKRADIAKSEINDLKKQIAELHASRESLLEYKNKVESDDFVLVPRKPTRKIVDSYWSYMGKDPYPRTMVFLWQEMIEASQ